MYRGGPPEGGRILFTSDRPVGSKISRSKVLATKSIPKRNSNTMNSMKSTNESIITIIAIIILVAGRRDIPFQV